MVKAGDLGKKTGQGFYTWKKGKKVTPKTKSKGSNFQDIQDRLFLRFLNEAVACYREGVVANKDHLDAGVVFGTGFAPFRGGPMNYIETVGASNLLTSLNALHEKYGERFKPDSGWQNLIL